MQQNLKVVSLGGGHGLAATLRALRSITPEITAVVTVADNGGSSGRLRAEFDVLPPGDLRMALAALCGDDEWGRGWAEILQYRFQSDGEMGGHTLGNLLLSALWNRDGDPVTGIDRVAELLKLDGRVLPMALDPLDIEALFEIDGEDLRVRGQVEVATTKGEVKSLQLIPAEPRFTPEARDAILGADWITFGPGSWFSSVMPHLLLRAEADAIAASSAKKIVIFNLPEPMSARELAGSSTADHLRFILDHLPSLHIDYALVDKSSVLHEQHLADLKEVVESCGGVVIVEDLRCDDDPIHHDVIKLNSALSHIFNSSLLR